MPRRKRIENGETVQIDKLDRKIMEFLSEDGRTPFTTIAAELGVAEGTVRKRVNRLLETGVLKIVGIADPGKLGMNTIAIVGIKVHGDQLEEVGNYFREVPEVRYVGVATGEFDLMVELTMRSNEELLQFLTRTLREVPGIASSQTFMIMKVLKDRY